MHVIIIIFNPNILKEHKTREFCVHDYNVCLTEQITIHLFLSRKCPVPNFYIHKNILWSNPHRLRAYNYEGNYFFM